MEKQKILQADYLDIVFDNRNKKYGGYNLRKKYPDRAKRALTTVLLSVGLICTMPVIASSLHKKDASTIDITRVASTPTTLETISIPHRPAPSPQPAPAQPAANKQPAAIAATAAFTEPKIVDGEITNETPPASELTDKMIGTSNNEGTPGGKVADTKQTPGDGDGEPHGRPGHTEPPIEGFAEIMPSFDGDIYAYLSNNTRYPETAREKGQEGRVILQFIVHESGTISDVEVVRSAGKLLDTEALRVVKNMPKWKPGKTKGKAVKVYYSLPITFTLG